MDGLQTTPRRGAFMDGLKTICAFVSIIPVRCRLHLQGSKLVMEQRGPQDAENTTVISAHSAEDVGSPDLVAPKQSAGGYRGHVGRHGPRAVQCAPLHPHEVLPAGVHAAR